MLNEKSTVLNFASEKKCEICIEKTLQGFDDCLKKVVSSGKVVVICDTNVEKYCVPVFSSYQIGYDLLWYVIKSGEGSKSLKVVDEIYGFLYEHGVNRYDTIVAFGGGVVGDVVGFVAATYLRGVRLVQLPTTMLAQVDSSIGGKVGVNYKSSKNFIGSFYQPSLVYDSLEFLRTLGVEQIKACLSEVIARSLVADAALFEYIEAHFLDIVALESDALLYVIRNTIRIKSSIVEKDEFECDGLRVMLNLGHTFGHALESYHKFRFHHGYCVALGIVFASFLANETGYLSLSSLERIASLLDRAGCLVKMPRFDFNEVYAYMLKDKKAVDDELTFVIPTEIGCAKVLVTCSKDLIFKTMHRLDVFAEGIRQHGCDFSC